MPVTLFDFLDAFMSFWMSFAGNNGPGLPYREVPGALARQGFVAHEPTSDGASWWHIRKGRWLGVALVIDDEDAVMLTVWRLGSTQNPRMTHFGQMTARRVLRAISELVGKPWDMWLWVNQRRAEFEVTGDDITPEEIAALRPYLRSYSRMRPHRPKRARRQMR